MKRTQIEPDPALFPAELHVFLRDAPVYDSSCSNEARVWYIEKDGGLFLKRYPSGGLRTEAQMTAHFHTLGLSAEVLVHMTCGRFDWLLTRRIPGEDCTHPMYRSEPERLCDTVAERLRALHELSADSCPVTDRLERYRAGVLAGHTLGRYEPELFQGLWEFGSPDEARQAALAGLPLLKEEVLIHGDYCLPNILLNNWAFSGFIDLGSAGIADRHIDLLWGIWTLKFNLGTARYSDRFMDAYGRDRIDPEMLRSVAAMEMTAE